MAQSRQLLITAALPYANGPLHLGHLVETIQVDIWARYHRLMGRTCYFICGDDAHGTPVMLRAEQEGKTPEEWIAYNYDLHRQDFADFNISFDNFYTTHSPENKQLAELFYQRLCDQGDIVKKIISQAYDPLKNIFLPDRYVKGECPKCHASDQYGDSCEQCGATYAPLDLINPRSVISGATPISRDSEHCFFQLKHYQDILRQWFQQTELQENVVNKLNEWFEQGLQDWDISRDAPYFGFTIPGYDDKYFYVWLDAPIGYMSAFQHFCDQHHDRELFQHFWQKNSPTELYHFIGKDVMYFHTLFWPALLTGAGFRLPSGVFTHGFLTINGLKMSKSRGTFITVRDYLNHLPADCLRYYFASKLTPTLADIDFSLVDFKNKINSDLVGKVINLASRAAGFIQKNHDGLLAEQLDNAALYQSFVDSADEILANLEKLDYAKAMRLIMQLADRANQYVDEKKPWTLNKLPDKELEVQQICTTAINLFRVLMTYLKPIIPDIATKSETFLNAGQLDYIHFKQPLLNHHLQPFVPLLTRITDEEINQLIP